MSPRYRRYVSALMTVILLCALIPTGGAASSVYTPDALLTVVATSHMEPAVEADSGTEVVGVAFRFSLQANGVAMGYGRRPVLTEATVDPTGAGVRYPLVGMGAVCTNRAAVAADTTRLVRGAEGVTDIAVQRLYGIAVGSAEFAIRIVDIPFRYAETAVYARPYFVYRAGEEEITVYGGICAENSSGTKAKYIVESADLNWQAGTLDETSGKERDSAAAVRTDYVDHGDLMLRLPQDGAGHPTATARVFYYGSAGLLAVTKVTANWTVLSDLGIPEGTQALRIVVTPAEGAENADAAALAAAMSVTASRQAGVVPLTFSAGSLSPWDGTETAAADHNRTGYVTVGDFIVKPESGCRFATFFYDQNKNYIDCTYNYTEKARRLTDIAPARAVYARFIVCGAGEKGALPAYLTRLNAYYRGCESYLKFTAEAAVKEPSVLTADLPAHQGMQNALWNMEQLVKITYRPKATVPQKVRDYPADVSHKGMVYSSTRIEQTYVPNNVSFHTFMTAVQNPNSYLYTVDLERDYGNKNGKTYYGAVCSTACAHALNIVPNYTTYQWTEIPDMVPLERQDLRDIQLCDTIVGEGHIVMVTEILRDVFGRIVQVSVSEASGSDVHVTKYTFSAFVERFPADKQTYCRYAKLAEVTYTPSDYVAVGKEEKQTVTYNTHLIPRKGDRANWRTEETVVLDVLKQDSFTHVELYKDGERVELRPIAAVIELTEELYHTPGMYQARLIREGTAECSAVCSWYVTDAASVAELYQDTRHVKISFSATNAEPLYVQWMNGTTNATIHITPLTQQHLADGYGIFAPATGVLKARVVFRTPYGIVYAKLPEAITVEKVTE